MRMIFGSEREYVNAGGASQDDKTGCIRIWITAEGIIRIGAA